MLLKIEKLNKIYNKGRENELQALFDVSLVIEAGEMIAVVGKSGSGKTTLLNVLGAIDNDYVGKYYLDNICVSNLTENQKSKIRNQKIGFVLQDFGLIESRTVYENVCIPLYFSKTKYSRMKITVQQVLEKLNIRDLEKRQVSQLSGGQKQRVAIARALVMKPDILLADEPTGALDSTTTDEMMEVLEGINQQGTTIIIVTHNHEVAERCDKTYTIYDGRFTSSNIQARRNYYE